MSVTIEQKHVTMTVGVIVVIIITVIATVWQWSSQVTAYRREVDDLRKNYEELIKLDIKLRLHMVEYKVDELEEKHE
jgi:hypothetical protein